MREFIIPFQYMIFVPYFLATLVAFLISSVLYVVYLLIRKSVKSIEEPVVTYSEFVSVIWDIYKKIVSMLF
jgi:hypothetical protein